MPKLIDYPRTTYASAWEVAEVVDDTGGKCALETCARKLDRKVSGSFKAIVGSAVKFGLLRKSCSSTARPSSPRPCLRSCAASSGSGSCPSKCST